MLWGPVLVKNKLATVWCANILILIYCTLGVATWLQDPQLHSGGPWKGGELYWLLQWRRQALPHIRGWWPPGQDLGLSGTKGLLHLPHFIQVTVYFKLPYWETLLFFQPIFKHLECNDLYLPKVLKLVQLNTAATTQSLEQLKPSRL